MVTQLSSTKVAVKSFILLDKGWIWTPKRSTKEEFPRDTELNHKKFSPLRKHIESCVPRHLQGTPPQLNEPHLRKSPASNCLQFKLILSFRALCTSRDSAKWADTCYWYCVLSITKVLTLSHHFMTDHCYSHFAGSSRDLLKYTVGVWERHQPGQQNTSHKHIPDDLHFNVTP